MRHFPIFLELTAQRVVVSGAGECAVAKLRLILKTKADVLVLGLNPVEQIVQWAIEKKITYIPRTLKNGDADNAVLLYAANEDDEVDAHAASIGRSAGALVNIVDNLKDSDFITPAIVDRSPVTIAIGTEGAAPVLARKIKQQLEETLPASLGVLARIGQKFRSKANALPMGRKRRAFWSEFYFYKGPNTLALNGEAATTQLLDTMLDAKLNEQAEIGRVHFMGTGNGDADLLTLKARNILHNADVIIHDHSTPKEILELVRREAILHAVNKTTATSVLNSITAQHVSKGNQVIRLVSGDLAQNKGVFAEMSKLNSQGISYEVVKGIPLDPPFQFSNDQSAVVNLRHVGLYQKHPQHLYQKEMVGS